MGFIGLVADAATTIQQETDEITRFFSIAHVKQLLNDLGNWSVSLIGKIVIAVLIWFIGKKIIRVLDKLVKKMLVLQHLRLVCPCREAFQTLQEEFLFLYSSLLRLAIIL